jgi:putative ABC transport system permease protein
MKLLDIDIWTEIWQTITHNKIRSLLTGFGVFWGIFMLVIMMGAGTALQNGIMRGTVGFATNTSFFYSERTTKPYKGLPKNRGWNFHNRDLEIIERSVTGVELISAILFGGRQEGNVVYGDRSGAYNVRGVHSNYGKIESQRISYGRYLNDVDILQKRKVCVIGTRVYEEMFKRGEDPIGKLLKVKGIYYSVVGVAEGVSNISIGGRSTESVLIPITTFQQAYNQGDIVHIVPVLIRANENIDRVESEIKAILRAQNKVAPNDEAAIGSFSLAKEFRMFEMLFLGIRLLVWIVGIGTLLAGVVGVTNIMVVTVRERTREIGVRRALGAKPNKIVMQIMSESLLLTAIAGLVGLTTGVGLLSLVDSILAANPSPDRFFINPQINFSIAIAAAVVLLFSGLLAGVIPTLRALKIKAIDAIREE